MRRKVPPRSGTGSAAADNHRQGRSFRPRNAGTPPDGNSSRRWNKYQSTFLGSDEKTEECPMSTPLLMYFDFSKNEQGQPNNPNQNQTIKGLSDVIFSVEGDNDLEKARTLKRCWCHTNEFGEINKVK